MKRRLLAWILVIAMGISCVPLQVFAQEDSGEPEPVLMEATVETTEATEETTEATVDTTEATQTATEEPLLLEQAEAAESTEKVLLLEETAVGDEEIPAEGVSIVLSGYCGDNMAYALDSEGVLTISGSGSMNDYGKDKISVNGVYVTNAPWRNKYLNINKIVIKGSVEEIGNYAFYSCYPIEELDLSGNTGLKSIGDYAFDTAVTGIDGIKTLNLPNTVSYIGFGAFSFRNHLTSVTIEENPDPEFTCTINNGAFAYCDKLENVQLSNNVTSIGGICFLECPLKSITLPENLTYLGYKAFGDTSITDITIPASLNSCGYATSTYDGPFAKCTTLTSAAIEDGATTIPAYLFSNAENLTNVTIPETVTSIGTKAFYGCTALKSIYIPASVKQIAASFFGSGVSKVYYGGTQSQWGAVTVDAINGLPTPQFSHTHSYTTETTNAAGETVYVCECGCYTTELPTSGENSGSCGANVTYSLSADGVFTISGSGPMTDYDYEINGGIQPLVPWASRMQDIKSVVVTGTVENIGAYSFYEAENLTTLNLSGNRNLRSIGESAFQGCALNALSLPNTLTSIGDNAFSGCYDLAISLRLPGSVSSIGDNAFACTGITSVTMLDNTTSGVTIGNMAFYACESLTDVTLSDNVTHLGNGVFGYTSVADLTIPASVTSCGTDYERHGPLADNRNLKSVTIAEGATAIPENLFAYAQLEYVNIPESVTSFGANSFWRASLQSIYIPTATKTIADCGFSDLAQAYYGGTQSQWNAVTVDAANALPTPQFSHTHSYTKAVTNNAGQTIYACTCGGYQYEQQLPPTAQYNTIAASDITLTADNTKAQTASLNASAKGGAALSYQSNNASVTVTTAGVVTVAAGFSGTAKITITAAATTEYLETTKVVTVTVNPAPVANADAEIVVGSLKALAGKDITVPVTITKNPGICTYGFQINYDASVLLLEDISEGSLTNGKGRFIKDIDLARATWLSDENVTETGELMTIHFTVLENALEGPTAVSVSLIDGKKSNLANMADQTVSATFTAGSIDVARGILGDVNEDGEVAMLDVSVLNRFVLGKVTLSDTAQKLGDVNHDGEIAMLDVSILNRFVLGKISQLSVASTNVAESADRAANVAEISAASVTVQAADVAVISAGSVTARAGEMITVPVTITNNPGICTYGFQINYDASVLTLNDISEGLLTNGKGRFIKDIDLARATWLCDENITGTGELLTISFTVKEGTAAGSTPISVSLIDGKKSNLGSADDTVVAADFVSGEVKVPCPNTIYAEDITVTGSNEQDITVPLNATALGNAVLRYQSDDDAVTINEEGVITVSKGFDGTVKITITAKATDKYLETTKIITLTVKPAPVPNTITAPNVTLTVNEEEQQTVSLNAVALGGAALSYRSDSEDVTVSNTGVVTIPAGFLGTAKITITAAAVEGYLETTKVITVSVTAHNTIDAEDLTVTGSIVDAITVPLNATARDGAKLRYSSSTAYVTISDDGMATISKGFDGTVKITITAKATDKYLETTKIITLTVKPAPIPNTIKAEDIFLTVNEKEDQTASINASALGGAALTYHSDSEDVTVTYEGEVTVAAGFLGTAKITITAAAVEGYLETTKTVTVTVNPLVMDPDVKLMVGSETVYGNESITIPVYLTRNRGISRLTLNVNYDPALLTLDGISAGQTIENLGTFTDAENGSASWTYTKDITTIGQLALLHFSVSENATDENMEARISVSLSGLTNKADQEKTFTSIPGQVKVYYYSKLYTITYDANGGENAPEAQQKWMLLISDQVPTRKYHKFLGWAEKPDAEEAQYEAGENYGNLDKDITLYAVWEYVPSAIVVEKSDIDLISGQSVKLNACAYPDENAKILFALDDPEDSQYVTLKGNVLTAKNVKDITWVDITATTDNDSAPPADISVTIYPKVTRVDITQDGIDNVLNNKTLTVNTNEKYIELLAVTYPEDAWYEVTWKSSNPSIAEVDYGFVTLHKSGKVTITATAADGSKKSAKVTLNVVQPTASLEILNAPETLQGGQKFTLKTDISQNVKGIDRNVTWVLDEDSAAFASLKNGALTTKVVYEPVTIHVTAYATANPEAIDEADITLLPAATAASILYKGSITEKTTVLPLKVGETLELEGGCYPADAYGTGSWKSSSTKYATVDENGIVKGVKAGVVTITYSYGGKSTSVKVQVGNPVTELTISAPGFSPEQDIELRSGKSMTLKADFNDNASIKKVTWALANAADSAYCSISSSGKLTAKTVYSRHDVTIKATAVDGTGMTRECTVSILPKTDTVMAIMDDASHDITGKTVLLESGNTMNVGAMTGEISETAAWKSSNTKVATIEQSGIITAQAPGTAKITATVGKRTASFTIKVATKVKTITVGVKNNLPAVLMSGKSLNMTALTNNDASNKKVTWSLAYPNNDPKCATISSSGALKAAAGLTRQTEVQVIATAADGSGICSAPFTVKLYPAATGVNILKAGRVVNGLTSVTDEKETALTAKVYPDAAYQGVTWKSSSTKIATVDANGKVTFLKAGTVTITATAADGSKKAASFKLTYAPGK